MTSAWKQLSPNSMQYTIINFASHLKPDNVVLNANYYARIDKRFDI